MGHSPYGTWWPTCEVLELGGLGYFTKYPSPSSSGTKLGKYGSLSPINPVYPVKYSSPVGSGTLWSTRAHQARVLHTFLHLTRGFQKVTHSIKKKKKIKNKQLPTIVKKKKKFNNLVGHSPYGWWPTMVPELGGLGYQAG